MRLLSLSLAFALAGARRGLAAAQPWPDDDRLVDDDPTVTCRAEHTRATSPRATTPWSPPTCLRHARLGDDRIELLTKVAFDLDKDTPRPLAFAVLDDVAALLLRHPELALDIQGHGREENYGLELSDRRARAVMAFLIMRGVAPRRLQAQGYADSVPLVPWTAKDAARLNIRIELRLLRPAPPPAPPPPALPAIPLPRW